MDGSMLETVQLSLFIAAGSTALVALPGIALGYLLARHEFRGRSVVETLAALP